MLTPVPCCPSMGGRFGTRSPINTEDRALAGFSAAELAELQERWERERR